MKQLTVLILLFIVQLKFVGQTSDSLFIYYYESKPFAYKDGEAYKGIEFDILNEYLNWLKTTKKINYQLIYKGYSTYSEFYNDVKASKKNSIGIGSVSNTTERKKEIEFTEGYMKNLAFCVTNGNAPDVKTKAKDDVIKVLGAMTALTLTNTTLESHCKDLKKQFITDLKIKYISSCSDILTEISKNILNFGYVDAVEFWFYLKANPGKFSKMQRVLSQSKDQLAHIIPKGSKHKVLYAEFFNTFKTTKNYRVILEKYVGGYMAQNLAIN